MIQLSFDPAFQLGDLVIRWQTVGVTVAILLGLGFAALIDGYLAPSPPAQAEQRPEPADASGDRAPAEAGRGRLRLDDLAYIALGIVPGAVVGGRLVHGLAYWDAYTAAPTRLLDPSVGSLSLLGAVLGGAVSGAYVVRVLGAPVRRWADAAALPLLLALGLGKLAQLLGGSGQGAAWDGAWAVAFMGDGPWISRNPHVPAHPAQVYEAIWLLAGVPVLTRSLGRRRSSESRIGSVFARLRGRQLGGRLFAVAVGWFLLGRVVVGFTWRDDGVIGPLNAEQAMALVLWALLVLGALGAATRRRREPIDTRADAPG